MHVTLSNISLTEVPPYCSTPLPDAVMFPMMSLYVPYHKRPANIVASHVTPHTIAQTPVAAGMLLAIVCATIEWGNRL